MAGDYKDFTIRYEGHPRYNSRKIIETDSIEFILQKIEMVLFTGKGDVLGDPDFGADLEYYLWATVLPGTEIEDEIRDQFEKYIPEIDTLGYTLSVDIFKGSVRDIMYVNVGISDKKVNFVFE